MTVMPETIINLPVDERAGREAEAILAKIALTPSEFLRRAMEPDSFLPIALVLSASLEKPSEERAAFRELVLKHLRSDIKDNLARLYDIHQVLRHALEILDAMQEMQELQDALQGGSVPNAETVAAIEAAERGEFVGEYTTDGEFQAWLENL
jgi:hypothetical protein